MELNDEAKRILKSIELRADEYTEFIKEYNEWYETEIKAKYGYLEDFINRPDPGKGVPKKNVLNGRKRRSTRKLYNVYEDGKLLYTELDSNEIASKIGASHASVYHYINHKEKYKKGSKLSKYIFEEVK